MFSTEARAALAGRVTIVGNPGLDTLVLLAEELPDLRADGHFVRNVDTVGHAASFTAWDMARLGHAVTILGAVGDDAIGRMVADVLAADGSTPRCCSPIRAGRPGRSTSSHPTAGGRSSTTAVRT